MPRFFYAGCGEAAGAVLRRTRGSRPPLICIFGALCAFCAALEFLLPKPLPFLRLGLSNAPILLALFLDAKSFFLLVAVKIFCQAFVQGSLFSPFFLFSALGGVSSGLVMFVLNRLLGEKKISLAGLSVCGALASNLCQIFLARNLVLGKSAIFIAPPFLIAGFITGLTVGIFCEIFRKKSLWLSCVLREYEKTAGGEMRRPWEGETGADAQEAAPNKKSVCYLAAGAVFSFILIQTNDIIIKFIYFIIILIFFILSKKKNNYAVSAVFMAGIVFFNLFPPYGKTIGNFGSFRLTEGALLGGLDKALTIECLILVSRLCVKKELRLPGVLGSLVCGTLAVVNKINERKNEINPRTLVKSLDALLFSVFPPENET
ncbi:MAG: Gx transporter family protein [Spirochaetaceae bacterium]|nr:Gx transporter family protein [Spirochaetaceae bacterium]